MIPGWWGSGQYRRAELAGRIDERRARARIEAEDGNPAAASEAAATAERYEAELEAIGGRLSEAEHQALRRRRDTQAPPERDYEAIIRTMRATGREDVIHFAGAAHRDDAAARVVEEWLLDPTATERALRRRALDLPEEQESMEQPGARNEV